MRSLVTIVATLGLASAWACKSPRVERPVAMLEAGSDTSPPVASAHDPGPATQPRATSRGVALAGAACQAVAAEVGSSDPGRKGSGLARGGRALELAIARGDVECTRLLVDAGLDANTAGTHGQSLTRWLGSGQGVNDDDVLAVARLLDEHHARFGPEPGSLDLLTNLATRHLPKTLAFLAQKNAGWDYDAALTSLARRDDIESVQVLLAAGADPLSGPSRRSALLDAASEGMTATVAAMLKVVRDKASPKVLAAYRVAIDTGHADTARAFVSAGIQPPATPATPQPACQRRELAADEAALMSRLGLPSASGLVGMAGGMTCKVAGECGTILLVDCNAAADGPAYYVDRATGRLLATCGGACMKGCQGCPPPAWTCSCRL